MADQPTEETQFVVDEVSNVIKEQIFKDFLWRIPGLCVIRRGSFWLDPDLENRDLKT